jgi:hypothetical protein
MYRFTTTLLSGSETTPNGRFVKTTIGMFKDEIPDAGECGLQSPLLNEARADRRNVPLAIAKRGR